MENTKIGTAEIRYRRNGSVLYATFTPAVHMLNTKNLYDQIPGSKNVTPDVIKSQADQALAGWFSEVANLELRDPEQYRIESVVELCEKFSGKEQVKKCVITYWSNKIN